MTFRADRETYQGLTWKESFRLSIKRYSNWLMRSRACQPCTLSRSFLKTTANRQWELQTLVPRHPSRHALTQCRMAISTHNHLRVWLPWECLHCLLSRPTSVIPLSHPLLRNEPLQLDGHWDGAGQRLSSAPSLIGRTTAEPLYQGSNQAAKRSWWRLIFMARSRTRRSESH